MSSSLMKIHHFIAPSLALIGSAVWLYLQEADIRELTEKTKVIKERIVIVEKATLKAAASLASPKNPKQDEFTLPDGSLDWQMIASLMVESQGAGGMPRNIKTLLRLQQKFMGLTEDELIDGLAKISTLDLPPSAIEMMKQGLLNQLSEKNPIAALEALGDPVTDRSNSTFWSQNQILTKVAKTDPAAAIAWLDKKIAEGKLESTSLDRSQDPRLMLEGALIGQLITSNYDAARSRLENFSDSEKAQLLSSSNHGVRGDAALNFLELARETLPPELASKTISQTLGNQYLDSLTDITETLADLPLNENERTAVVENLVGNYSRNNESDDKYEEIYQWSRNEAPGQEAALVSNALNSSNNWQNPQETFEEALAVSESLSDPDILTSFISQFSSEGNESVVALQLEKFSDPEVAEQYRNLVESISTTLTESE